MGLKTYSDLILDAGDVEERLDLLPELVPWPGAQLEVLAQVPLAHLERQTLLLQFLELLPRQVTAHPGLHPGDDLAQTVVTQLLHLTQDTGTEEHLIPQEPVKYKKLRKKKRPGKQQRRKATIIYRLVYWV